MRIEGELVSLPVMGKDQTHRLQHVRTATCAIIFHSPYHSLSMSRLHCFVELRAFQWQESRFFFFFFLNSTAWSDTDARTFLELAAFPSGRDLHTRLYSSLFLIILFSPKIFHPTHCACEEGKWENWVECVSTSSFVVVCAVVFKELHTLHCCFATTIYTIYSRSCYITFICLDCLPSLLHIADYQFSSQFDSEMLHELQNGSFFFFQGFLILQQMAVWITLSAQASLLQNCCFYMFMVIQTPLRISESID